MNNRNINDSFLFYCVKNDDVDAFKVLFDTYFTPVYRFISLYIKEKRIIEELALDVFTMLWEKRDTIEIKISLKAYLFQSARNHTFNYIRDNRQILTHTSSLPEFAIDDDYLEVKELEKLIEEAIYTLPEKCKEIFSKSRFENLSHKEIASEMEITTKAVEAQITKALKRIKAYLKNKYSFLW